MFHGPISYLRHHHQQTKRHRGIDQMILPHDNLAIFGAAVVAIIVGVIIILH